MKKFILPAIIMFSVGLALFGCNNGAYDANPGVNNGNVPNPSVTGTGLGHIKMNIAGESKDFSPCTYSDVDKIRAMGGYGKWGTTNEEQVAVFINEYSGATSYTFDGTIGGKGSLSFMINDGTDNHKLKSLYSSGTGDATKGRATINVTSEVDNKISGTFSGVIYKTLPSLDLNDSLVVTNGTFYVQKQ